MEKDEACSTALYSWGCYYAAKKRSLTRSSSTAFRFTEYSRNDVQMTPADFSLRKDDERVVDDR